MKAPAALALVLLTGCTANEPYQLKSNPTVDSHLDLSFCSLEFDDQGELFRGAKPDEDPLARVRTHIRDKGQAKGAVVFFFVHGWNHNASEPDENVQALKELLARRAQYECDKAKGSPDLQPIIGVFIGWRGKSTTFLPLFSFWSRGAAAARVASITMTDVLLELLGDVRKTSDSSLSVVIGHSFGGVIVEHALAQAFLGMSVGRRSTSDRRPRLPTLRPPADLVVLVNPASSALSAKQFIEALIRSNIQVSDPGRPLLVSVTSEADLATKDAFPIGQAPVSWTKKFRSSYPDLPDAPSQLYLFRHTAGHVPFLHSHTVREVSRFEGPPPDGAIPFKVWDKGLHREYSMEPRTDSNVWNKTGYWITSVPKEVIPNHSDIFRESFESFLTAILERAQIHRDPGKRSPQMIKEQAQ
jgi:hypothetical protein